MLKSILSIVSARYAVAFLNLVLMMVNARVLGIEGVGLIGLIGAAISIIATVNGLFSGNTLVYFLNKYPLRTLFPIAAVWTFVGSALGCGALTLLGVVPKGYAADIYGVTVLYSLTVAHARFLLAKERIVGFNLANLLQGGLLFFIMLFFYYALRRQTVGAYIAGLYVANAASLIVGILLLLPLWAAKEPCATKPFLVIVKEMFVYGLWGTADNIAETCTMRLNYFLLERFGGTASVGLFDAATKVAESVWHISRSVAFMAYSRVAKTPASSAQRTITFRLLTLTLATLATVTMLILFVPERIYTHYLFNESFVGIRSVITALAVGIVAMGGNAIISHYFIGSGQVKYSTTASLIGFLALLIAAPLFIPHYAAFGAAIATSVAYLSLSLFSFACFTYRTNLRGNV